MDEGERRRRSRVVRVGSVLLGGGWPVSVQTMTKTDTRDVRATVAEVQRLATLGCDIVRVAVPDEAAARAVREIKRESPLPLVADIHFDWRLALMCLEAGVDKLRLNPGNIGSAERVRTVARAAAERGVPIRVGANAGSVSPETRRRTGGDTALALVESALEQARTLEEAGLPHIVVSVKAYDLGVVTRAYREVARRTDYPLHLGVTEAGAGLAGTVRSAAGIGSLLLEGIGDTLRVSLTGPPDEEVAVGRELLLATGHREGLCLVSCPTCGRATVELGPIVAEVREGLRDLKVPLRVAVMGCEVNGPGEARDADLGVAVAGGRGVLFVRGRVVRRLERQEIVPALLKEARRLAGLSGGERS
ncbi:MAG: flavodoxin-dependent (E)-4-hydroxy-3-methylbut-2-enyl-diphosphate synthase [Firmicutes bacterium]|nr:flavodoxin-dependent (E)-4-hydroxy-3-methylbut-2-enyl-diphosphate synthase [Bacillota bacterium]